MIDRKLHKIGAWLLLTVFLTMIVFTDFHRHKITVNVIDCTFCEHHLPHSNHISQSYSSQDICLLCQFSLQEYDYAKIVDIKPLHFFVNTIHSNIIVYNISYSFNCFFNKAPPLF